MYTAHTFYRWQLSKTHCVVKLEKRPVLPERVGVGDLDAEALSDLMGPCAPPVLHQVSRKLYAQRVHRGTIWVAMEQQRAHPGRRVHAAAAQHVQYRAMVFV